MVALFIRVLAAIFAKGYAFHDDHFCVTRVAQSWANGIPHWLESDLPPKHSMFYAGINAAIMWVSESIGIEDTYAKTTVLRLVHALYSMLIVWFVYKITLFLSDRKKALLATWIVALLWFMPYMSVRFLVEMVCIPPMLAGIFYVLKASNGNEKRVLLWLAAGALFGIAFTFRMHTILFAGGMGLVLLYQRQWKGSILFTIGYLIAAFLIIGVSDTILFDYPFHSLVEYFRYNSANANNFISGSPFKFALTTLGFLVPPVSVLLMFGFARSFKVSPAIFLAVLVFFVFHSSFPNQQERFILPMFPLVIIMGTIGWQKFREQSKFWAKYPRLLSGLWTFFWVANILVAFTLAFTFIKKDRVDPLHYLSQKTDVKSVIVENEKSVKQVPVYFLGDNASDYQEWDKSILGINKLIESKAYLDDNYKVVFSFPASKSQEELKFELERSGKHPNYIILQGGDNLDKRINRVLPLLEGKKLVLETVVEPSNIDKLLHYFNPRVHRDQTAFVYKAE